MKNRGWIAAAVIVGVLVAGLLVGAARLSNLLGRGPDPESIASGSLESMREQARLTAFAARYVAVVTSTQQRFGLSAQKTLILPGLVRYEVDLARLRQQDMRWNEGEKTLSISLPPLDVSSPEIDMSRVQEYSGGGVLMALTGAEDVLDAANRARAQRELVRQAREALPMRLAREAAVRAVERSFAMPLRAAGIDAAVEVRFADDPGQERSQLDRSRRIEDVLKDRQASR